MKMESATETKPAQRFRVQYYGTSITELWCIVDGTRYYDQRCRDAGWPMMIRDRCGTVMTWSDRNDAAVEAVRLNKMAAAATLPILTDPTQAEE